MKLLTAFGVVLLFSSACYAGQLDLRIPNEVSPAAKKLLNQSWPKVKTVFPGIDRYADSLSIMRVTDDLKSPFPEYRKVTVELVVPSGRSSIPNAYKAWGHHCHLDIDAAGRTAAISKRPCKSVLLDRNVDGTEHDNGDDLRVRLR